MEDFTYIFPARKSSAPLRVIRGEPPAGYISDIGDGESNWPYVWCEEFEPHFGYLHARLTDDEKFKIYFSPDAWTTTQERNLLINSLEGAI